jgi:hypothetical protein
VSHRCPANFLKIIIEILKCERINYIHGTKKKKIFTIAPTKEQLENKINS